MKKTALTLTVLVLCAALLAGLGISVLGSSATVSYYPKCSASATDFADALDTLGIDSSRDHRSQIAAINGIENYSGTPAQDAMLLALLKNGTLAQSVPAPVDTTAPATEKQRVVEFYGEYTDVDKIYDYGSCPSMQGLAVGSEQLYCIKINSGNSLAALTMTNKNTGVTNQLYDTSDGSYYFTGFGHANDMDVWGIDGYSNLFITSTNEGSGAIWRLKRSGNGLTRVASYSLTYNGVDTCATALAIKSVENGIITFITKLGQEVYTGSVSTSATSATIPLTKLCTISKSRVIIKGETLDLSSWVNQGFDYHDGKLFVPVTGPSGQLNRSVVMVYDIEGASGTVYPDEYLTFRVTSSTYSALFEIESCGISSDGKLYFNTNRRKTTSDTNHDGVSSFDGYVYEPF